MDTTSRQTANTHSRSGGEVFWFLGAAGSVAALALGREPQARILAWVVSHPVSLLAASGLALLPVALFGTGDFRNARRRDYTPPSARVRVLRPIVYGLFLALGNGLFIVWLSPSLLPFIDLRRAGALLLTLALPYALGAWYVCIRPRTFVHERLPSFREAAAAHLDTNDFVIGRSGSDWKTGSGDPFWFVIPEPGMFANMYCLGGIGSGKTSSVAKPIIEQALFKYPAQNEKKIGIFMLDAKGNNAEYVLERARRAGREKDVIILRAGGEWSYNPLASGTPTAIANKLVAALEVMTEQESNSYYKKMQREFAENAIQILADVLGAGKFSMMDLYEFITDPKIQGKFLKAALPTNSIAVRWFKNQWAREDPREQMMLTKGFRADLSSFVRDDIAPTFANANPNFPGWENLIDEGKIVIFSMSLDEYGEFARAMGIFTLMDFQSMMLARTTSKFQAAGHNRKRLVLCVLDEVWAYMNPKLAEFTSVSREARCCTLALHQSLGQVPEKYRQVVLGNFRTPIILAVNDLLTLSTFSQLFGAHKVLRRSVSESSGFAGVERQLLTDRLSARVGGESKSVSTSMTEMDEPRFSTDDLLHLPKNRAVIQMFDGDNTHPARVIETLPGWLEENKLA